MQLSSFTLKNGMQVIVLENHRVPLVFHAVAYHVGSFNEPRGKSGLAHLTEHMMFRASKHVKEFQREQSDNGIYGNAYTSMDHTLYHGLMDISKLELAMAMEVERMHNACMNTEDFTREHKIVYQERKEVVDSSPTDFFKEERLYPMLWEGTRADHSVIGSEQDILALTKEDLRTFYHRWYQPQNAILLLSGDITVAEAQTLAEKYYGKLENTSPLPVLPKDLPPLVEETNLVLRRKDVQNSAFYRYYRLDQGFLSKQEQLALLLLQKYCLKETNPLKEDLIRKQKIFSTLTLYPYYCSGLGTLEFTGNLVTPHPLEELVQIFTTAMEKALKALTEQHLEQAKRDVRYTGIYREDDLANLAIWVLEQYYNGFTLDEIQNYESLLNTVTVADLRAVWQKVCNAPAKINGLLEKCA